jgi:uncharacterized membrane protein YdbT with pleckstrin-like domain
VAIYLEIQPKFRFTYQLLARTAFVPIIAAFIASFLVMISNSHAGGILFVLCLPFAFIFGVVGIYASIVTALRYSKMKYAFADDRLIFSDHFITQDQKEIKYENIVEITLVEGVFQKRFGLGTIQLLTAAGVGAGMVLRDIEDAKRHYEKSRAIVKKRGKGYE